MMLQQQEWRHICFLTLRLFVCHTCETAITRRSPTYCCFPEVCEIKFHTQKRRPLWYITCLTPDTLKYALLCYDDGKIKCACVLTSLWHLKLKVLQVLEVFCLHREHVWVMCVPLMLLCAYKYVEEHFIFMIKHMLLAEKCSNDLKWPLAWRFNKNMNILNNKILWNRRKKTRTAAL